MKVLVNSNRGEQTPLVVLYPESWLDSVKCLIVKLMFQGFKRTWKGYPKKVITVGTIEIEGSKSGYPDECGCG